MFPQQPIARNDLSRDFDPAETRISKEIAIIEKQIGLLIEKRKTLSELLMKMRGERLANIDVSRKNSLNRVLAESIIVRELIRAEKSMTTMSLRASVRGSIDSINESTLRSYLFRMKNNKIITGTGKGMWHMEEWQKRAARKITV